MPGSGGDCVTPFKQWKEDPVALWDALQKMDPDKRKHVILKAITSLLTHRERHMILDVSLGHSLAPTNQQPASRPPLR
jgi:hypothetical protein